MDFLILLGTIVTLIGLCILIWGILRVNKARKNITDDNEMRDKLKNMAAVNMLALFLSFMGLMIVILGIIL